MVTVAMGAITTALLAWLLGIPSDLAAGIFSGALTSTPALASGIEAAAQAGQQSLAVSIGYGMAYPIGVIAVVLFVELLPRLLRVDLDSVGQQLQQRTRPEERIGRHLVEIFNPAVFGKSLHEIRLLDQASGQITRVLEGERLVPIKPDHVFAKGQIVLLVADEATAEMLTMILGESADVPVHMDSDRDRADVVVTSPELLKHTLSDLHLRSRFGVTIARIERHGVDFVPSANTRFSMADRVTTVGEPEGLKAFERAAGHRIRKLHETDLMSVGLGLGLGILIGTLPIRIHGLGSFTLGMAGGPLLAGLLFAHFGRLMGIVGYMPLAARMLTQELGLAFFLAAAGFEAGGHFVEMVQRYGAAPFAMSVVVAVVAMFSAYAFARFALRMDLMQTLGGTCGAMTSTAGIGAIANKTDSDLPVTSYAAAYPAALVMMTILVQLLVSTLI
jgi:putative transport protein